VFVFVMPNIRVSKAPSGRGANLLSSNRNTFFGRAQARILNTSQQLTTAFQKMRQKMLQSFHNRGFCANAPAAHPPGCLPEAKGEPVGALQKMRRCA
jgi:hypothetical protein